MRRAWEERWGRRPPRTAGLLLSLAVVASCGRFVPSLRAAFRDLSYPARRATPPSRDEGRSLLNSIAPPLLVTYSDPVAARRCYDALAASPRALSSGLRTFGACLDSPPPEGVDPSEEPEARFVRCASAGSLPGVRVRVASVVASDAGVPERDAAAPRSEPVASLLPDECDHVPAADRTLLALALAETAEALWSTLRARGVARSAPTSTLVEEAVGRVFTAAGRTISPGDGTATAAPRDHDTPTLALSGGAANGAFQAGYLFALLAAKERLRETIRAEEPEALRSLDASHFNAVAATSVGSLVSILVDLAESDTPTSGDARETLDRCVLEGRSARVTMPAGVLPSSAHGEVVRHVRSALAVPALPPERAAQECALHRLVRYFTTTEEWTLLCAQDASLLDLATNAHTTSALRFDPLERGIVAPWFARFGQLLMRNGTVRIPIAVDVNQNLTAALDERVCLDLSLRHHDDAAQRCLTSGVMASIMEPVFAAPVPRVWTGLDDLGDPGFWLDGGLRSGNPAMRAVYAARARDGALYTRVLAINTHRAEGIPSRGPAGAPGLLFDFVGGLVDQTRQWELAYSGALERLRRQRYGALRCLVEDCGAIGARVATPALPTGNVMSVFVPDDIRPSTLTAGGYVFDPVVMTGLFLWGQKSFLRDAAEVYRFLGWGKLAELSAEDEGAHVTMRAAAESAVESFLRDYPEPPENTDDGGTWWARHRHERYQRMERAMPICAASEAVTR